MSNIFLPSLDDVVERTSREGYEKIYNTTCERKCQIYFCEGQALALRYGGTDVPQIVVRGPGTAMPWPVGQDRLILTCLPPSYGRARTTETTGCLSYRWRVPPLAPFGIRRSRTTETKDRRARTTVARGMARDRPSPYDSRRVHRSAADRPPRALGPSVYFRINILPVAMKSPAVSV